MQRPLLRAPPRVERLRHPRLPRQVPAPGGRRGPDVRLAHEPLDDRARVILDRLDNAPHPERAAALRGQVGSAQVSKRVWANWFVGYRGDVAFAVMVLNPASARLYAGLCDDEADLLASAERPIVLLRKSPACDDRLPCAAPGLARIGLMLPYAPLHYLLFHELLGRPDGTDWQCPFCDNFRR